MKKKIVGMMTAAGNGSRITALTGKKIPKVLLHINKKPIIAYGIESLLSMNVKKIFIIVKSEFIDLFKKELVNYLKHIEFVTIDKTNHIMDSVTALSNFMLNSIDHYKYQYIYWLADNIFIGESFKESLFEILDNMNNEAPEFGFLSIETKTPEDFITLNKDGTWSEKPYKPETNTSATGVFALNGKALEDVNRRIMNKGEKEYTVWDSWMKSASKIHSKSITDTWIDVGTPERYLMIKKSLEQ